jgi:hypothetical protein
MQYHLAKMQLSWIEMDNDNLLISTKYDTHSDTQGSFEATVRQNKSLQVFLKTSCREFELHSIMPCRLVKVK